MTISLEFDWLHVLAALGIIAFVFFVITFGWNAYKVWLFTRGMK